MIKKQFERQWSELVKIWRRVALGIILLLLPAAVGPGHAHGIENPKRQAPTGSEIVEDIRQIEFNEIEYNIPSPDYFRFIEGRIPVLISAPHGAMHFRKRGNRWKGEDEYTAALAIKLGQLTGAHVMYVRNKAAEDPNNDLKSKYKSAVARAVKEHNIKFILDLHGSDEKRPFKVDIGILNSEPGKSSCPTFKETIQEVLSDFEPECFNKRFSANGAGTLTYFARKELGIEAAQVEINARYRIVERKPDSAKARSGIKPHFKADKKDVLDLVARLEKVIREIDRQIKGRTLARFE